MIVNDEINIENREDTYQNSLKSRDDREDNDSNNLKMHYIMEEKEISFENLQNSKLHSIEAYNHSITKNEEPCNIGIEFPPNSIEHDNKNQDKHILDDYIGDIQCEMKILSSESSSQNSKKRKILTNDEEIKDEEPKSKRITHNDYFEKTSDVTLRIDLEEPKTPTLNNVDSTEYDMSKKKRKRISTAVIDNSLVIYYLFNSIISLSFNSWIN